MSIDRLAQSYPVQFRWRQFPLHPETPAEGRLLTELFPGRDMEPMQRRMQELMTEAGLPYGTRSHTYNSRLAQELGMWADTQDDGDRLHRALFHAYFVDGINIGDADRLQELAAQADLDSEQARRVIDERLFSEAVDDEWKLARDAGIQAVPTFVHGDLMVVGCQPYDVLERFVRHLLEEAK